MWSDVIFPGNGHGRGRCRVGWTFEIVVRGESDEDVG